MKSKKLMSALVAVTVVGTTVLLSGCFAQPEIVEVVEVGNTVRVDYIGMTTEDSEVFDTSIESVAQANDIFTEGRPYEPLEFEVGAGLMIQGFDEGVVGMTVGEEKVISIPAEKGYGEYSEDNFMELPLSVFSGTGIEPEIGLEYNFGMRRGEVIEIGTGTITADFNHFLAGKDLEFTVTLQEIVNPESQE